MADEGFNIYLQSRPTATPLAPADMLLMNQGGALVMVAPSTISTVIPILINTAAGPAAFQLPAGGVVKYIKDDDSGYAATFSPLIPGQTIFRSALPFEWNAVQDEFIILQLIGSNWYRVG